MECKDSRRAGIHCTSVCYLDISLFQRSIHNNNLSEFGATLMGNVWGLIKVSLFGKITTDWLLYGTIIPGQKNKKKKPQNNLTQL